MRTQLHFSKSELALLDRMAAKTFYTRSGLVAAIIRQWLDDPGREIRCDVAEVPPRVALVAKYREDILRRWGDARERGLKRRWGKIKIDATFLAQLERFEKVKVSRSTLHRWAKSYRQHGLAGLIDSRQMVERPSKGIRGR